MTSTIYLQFKAAAETSPQLPFLIVPRSSTRSFLPEGVEISYGQALRLVHALASRYAAAGYGPGHRVAMVIGNRPDHFLHLFALNSVGASVVPLNPDYLPRELAYGVDFAKCALVVAAPPRLEDLRLVASGLEHPVQVLDATDSDAAIPAPARAAHPVASDPTDREAMIIYTSGTTGNPKGCSISNFACLAAGESYATAGGVIEFKPGAERAYNPLPTFHMNCTIYTLNAMTRIRGSLILQDRFHASTWWSDIAACGATFVHYMGLIPPLLLKQEPSPDERRHNVRFGFGGGADPATAAAFEKRFGIPLIEAWGMTETCRAIQNSGLPRVLIDRAFGRPRPPLEVRVADERDHELPFGTPGELLIRSAGADPRRGFFSGYINQPEETERAWRNGWFHTGDVVRQLNDGMLVFVERRKNIIRRSGENISAAEIEQVLLTHPEVKSVAAMAIPDEMHDEEVMACVVLAEGAKPSMENALSMQSHARASLSNHKIPAWVAFVDDLPLTGTQRVRKDMIFSGSDPRKDPRVLDLRQEKRRKPSPA